jgi:hypothetical protein
MIDYTIFYKSELPVGGPWPPGSEWDVLLSAYTDAERVRLLYERVQATQKHWLVFPEYSYSSADSLPAGAFQHAARNEAEFIQEFWAMLPTGIAAKRICVDTTGFIRPYLLFLMRWFVEQGVRRFDALYTEPAWYVAGEKTSFSDEAVIEVRQVVGYEGQHITDTSRDVLIVGAGYDDKLIAEVAEHKDQARKIQLFGLPSLRADMYQQNVLRAHRAESAVGTPIHDDSSNFFAPANDPFVTAAVLHEIVDGLRQQQRVTNLYLSPLATKAQVLGFALYYLAECRNAPVSVLFPFCAAYARETTKGLTRIWKYTIELPPFDGTSA